MQAAATSMRRLAQHRRVLSEVLDQQKATSEVLRVISNSPIDLQSALGAIAESAARLLDREQHLLGLQKVTRIAHIEPMPTFARPKARA